MNPKIVGTYTISQFNYNWLEAFEPDTLVLRSSKNQRLTLFEEENIIWLGSFFGKNFKSAIIENVTVLIYLEE